MFFGNQQQQQKPAFGQQTNAFGFGSANTQPNTTGGFGTATTQPTTGFGFGQPQQQQPQQQTSLFGSTTTSGFGSQPSTTSTGFGFGQPTSTTSGFGSQPSTGLGGFGQQPAQQTTSLRFGQQPAQQTSGFGFGQQNTATTSSPFGLTTSTGVPFGNTSSSFLSGSNMPTSATVNQGTGNPPYQTSQEKDTPTSLITQTYHSISAHPNYRNWSFEELRVKDYELGKKSATSATTGTTGGFGSQTSTGFGGLGTTTSTTGTSGFGSGAFGQPATSTTTSGFGQPTSGFGQQPTTTTSGFGSGFGSGAFGSNTSTTGTSGFGSAGGFGSTTSTPAFGQATTTPAFGSGFGSTSTTPAFGQQTTTTSPGFGFGQAAQQPTTTTNTGGLFGSATTPSTTSTFGTGTTSGFGFGQSNTNQTNTTTTTSGFGSGFGGFGQQQQAKPFGQTTTTSPFGQATTTTAAPTSGFSFGTTQPSTTTPVSTSGGLFGQNTATTTAAPTTSGFGSFGGFGQTQQQQQTAAKPSLFGQQTTGTTSTTSNMFGQQQPAASTTTTSLFGPSSTTASTTTPSFSFGQQPAQTTTTTAPATTTTTSQMPSFSFGQTPATTTTATPSLFGPSSTTATTSTPSFSFGTGGTSGGLFNQANTTTTATTTQPSASTGLFNLPTFQPQQQQQQLQQPSFSSSINQNAYGTNPLLKSTLIANGTTGTSTTTTITLPAANGQSTQVEVQNQTVAPTPLSSKFAPAKPISTLKKRGFTPKRPTAQNQMAPPPSFVWKDENNLYTPDQLLSTKKNIKKLILPPQSAPANVTATPATIKSRATPAPVLSVGNGVSLLSRPTPLASLKKEFQLSTMNGKEKSLIMETPVRKLDFNFSPSPQPVMSEQSFEFMKPKTIPKLPSDYVMTPSPEMLMKLPLEQWKQIQNFSIEHRQFGRVQWLRPVDLHIFMATSREPVTKEQLLPSLCHEVVRFTKCMCEVYPEPPVEDEDVETLFPHHEQGEGLNLPAEITLYNCFPKKHETVDKFVQKLKRTAETEFLEYNEHSGHWRFLVQHFSRFGLLDDDEGDDVVVKVDDELLQKENVIEEEVAEEVENMVPESHNQQQSETPDQQQHKVKVISPKKTLESANRSRFMPAFTPKPSPAFTRVSPEHFWVDDQILKEHSYIAKQESPKKSSPLKSSPLKKQQYKWTFEEKKAYEDWSQYNNHLESNEKVLLKEKEEETLLSQQKPQFLGFFNGNQFISISPHSKKLSLKPLEFGYQSGSESKDEFLFQKFKSKVLTIGKKMPQFLPENDLKFKSLMTEKKELEKYLSIHQQRQQSVWHLCSVLFD